MGYQIGSVCYGTKAEAENVYFSQVIPVLREGKLDQPVYTPLGWQLHGQSVRAYLPECNPSDSFKDGQMIGWALFSMMAAIWSVKLIRERLRL